jgi:glc operon protein GlcG
MNAVNFVPPARRQLAIEAMTDASLVIRSLPPVAGGRTGWGHPITKDAPTLTLPRRPEEGTGTGRLATLIVRLVFSAVISMLMISALLQSAAADEIAPQPTLTIDGAKSLAAFAVASAREKRAPGGAIAIVDAGGNLLYLERLDGTFAAAAPVSMGKARTAAYFRKPTRVFEDTVNKGRYTMLAVAEIAPFTPLTGGVPIEVDGQVIGAIGLSGAASAQQDDEIAVAAVEAFLKSRK